MKYSQANMGRVFVVRLEDGDILHECIEHLAREQKVERAAVIAVGGADAGSCLVVGPATGRPTGPILPLEWTLENPHEIAGTGTLFPDESGAPILHMHAACGRNNATVTGCVRRGVKVWHVLEVIVMELTHNAAMRRLEQNTGFSLLQP